jgi:hypothetical protein
MKLRTTKLVKVIIVSGACLTLFAYAFVKLVQSLSVVHQGSKRDMNHVDNQYDPEQDDVVGVEEELDIDLEAGKQMKHGLNLTMNSFNRYNAEVDSIAKQYNRPHMVAEVRRDMKIMDSDHDDWSQKRRPGKHQEDTYFSTYNTLTNV